MVNHTYKYTKEELEAAVANSVSYAETLRRLNIPIQGNNNVTLKHKISQWGIDTSHFTGHARNIPHTHRKLEDYLNGDKTIRPCVLFRMLKDAGLKEDRCELCGIGDVWNGKPLQLQLHHIDGNNKNNSIANLQVVCPNCHSQTVNFKNKRWENYEKKKYYCIVCGRELKTNCATQMCLYCSSKSRRKADRPSYESLLNDIQTLGYCGTGRKYGVSDNAVRKWIKSYV